MDLNIRKLLEEEMYKCNSLRLFKNRVKKCNEILPDNIIDNIVSYIQCNCRKCVKTRRVMNSEPPSLIKYLNKKWEGFDIEEKIYTNEYNRYQNDGLKVWLYYFVELNKFPREKIIQKCVSFNKQGNYHLIRHYYSNCFDYGVHFDGLRAEFKKPLHDVFIFMLSTRGCKFYPQVFNIQFQIAALHYMFVKGLD